MAERSEAEVSYEDIAGFLDAIPTDRVPAAIVVLAGRLLATPVLESEPEPEPALEQYLSPEEVADRLGVNRTWVYGRAEELGAVKLGRRTMRIAESSVIAYLDSYRVAPVRGKRPGTLELCNGPE